MQEHIQQKLRAATEDFNLIVFVTPNTTDMTATIVAVTSDGVVHELDLPIKNLSQFSFTPEFHALTEDIVMSRQYVGAVKAKVKAEKAIQSMTDKYPILVEHVEKFMGNIASD